MIAKLVFNYVNNDREKEGLQKLIYDNKLAKIAEAYSKQMHDQKFFGHEDPDGKNCKDRAQAAGYRYKILGENLHTRYYKDDTPIILYKTNQKFALEAHNNLMNSPGHRANILTPEYNRIGIGVYFEKNSNAFYLTQLFSLVESSFQPLPQPVSSKKGFHLFY